MHANLAIFENSQHENALRWMVLIACFGSSWTLPESLGAQPSTVIAVPSPLKKFMPSLHLEKLKEAKEGTIDFVMIGDSITHAWSKYPESFMGSNALNLGVPGDRTQNVLVAFAMVPSMDSPPNWSP